MPKKGQIFPVRDLRPVLYFNDWDGLSLGDERVRLGLTQAEVAKIVGVSPNAISAIERGISNNPWAIQCYGIILERYKAYANGYIPAYKKIGTNELMK